MWWTMVRCIQIRIIRIRIRIIRIRIRIIRIRICTVFPAEINGTYVVR